MCEKLLPDKVFEVTGRTITSFFAGEGLTQSACNEIAVQYICMVFMALPKRPVTFDEVEYCVSRQDQWLWDAICVGAGRRVINMLYQDLFEPKFSEETLKKQILTSIHQLYAQN